MNVVGNGMEFGFEFVSLWLLELRIFVVCYVF